MIELPRRSFLTGLGTALITAPAIVRAASLMSIQVIEPEWQHLTYSAEGTIVHYMGYDVLLGGPPEFYSLTCSGINRTPNSFWKTSK